MTVARSDFFSCFIWLEFCMIISNDFLFICTISGMFSMTCRFMAFSSMGNSMKNAYSCCMSPLAHHIINAWHDSGPDLQSAPTPWMLVASLPLEALNCFWLALPAWLWVLSWFLCLCGGGVCLHRLFFSCDLPLAAEVPVNCQVCVTLWSFCTVQSYSVIVQYCPPSLVAQTLYIQHTDLVCPEQGRYGVSCPLIFLSVYSTILPCLSNSVPPF